MNKLESLFVKQENSQDHKIGEENDQRQEISEINDQSKSLKDQINQQDNEKINSLRAEIATDISKSSDRFNPQEVLTSGQERFAGHLEKVSLRNLIGYIEKGGIKIKKIKELSLAEKQALLLLKKQEKRATLVNPRLYFLSKAVAGFLATKELLKRLKT